MLTISSAQRSTLIDARLGYVAEELKEFMRLNHAEAIAGIDDALVSQRIAAGLRRARGWGFETMFGLGLFVALMFEVAPDFDPLTRTCAALMASFFVTGVVPAPCVNAFSCSTRHLL
jgi:hypothetical protein